MKLLEYQQAFGAWDKTSDAMAKAIRQWFALYYRESADGQSDPCQRIAYTVVSKLSKAVFSEYTVHCDQPFYRQVLQALEEKRRQALELALVGGECYLKPCPTPEGFTFSVIPRDQVLVFSRDADGQITDMGCAQQSIRGKYYYTLLERRRVDASGYLTIENSLYRSLSDRSLGSRVALTELPEYRALQQSYTFPQPIGSVGLWRLKTPMLNCVDGSREGVSVYAPAVGLIRSIDENEAQLVGEFRRGQSRIILSRDLLDKDGSLSQNLFVGLDEDPEAVGLHIFSPELREQSYLARKQEYLRNVESVIGLKRGMLSDINRYDRTATEISASEGEFNLTVMDFQQMWQQCLEGCLCLCGVLGKLYGLCTGELPRVQIDWGNGVLYDEDKLWQDYRTMVSEGLIAPEIALGWRFNLPADTPQQRETIRKKYMPQ